MNEFFTVNTLLVLMKAIRERLNELKKLRDQVSIKETFLYGQDNQKVIEPRYDVKAVDKKVVELESFLFQADSAIKTSNAVTKIELDVSSVSLLSPLE